MAVRLKLLWVIGLQHFRLSSYLNTQRNTWPNSAFSPFVHSPWTKYDGAKQTENEAVQQRKPQRRCTSKRPCWRRASARQRKQQALSLSGFALGHLRGDTGCFGQARYSPPSPEGEIRSMKEKGIVTWRRHLPGANAIRVSYSNGRVLSDWILVEELPELESDWPRASILPRSSACCSPSFPREWLHSRSPQSA
jgi:hypothetical protein